MNTSIKTNQLEYSLNRDKFSEKYDIFCLETSDKYIKRGAYILDAAELCNDIKAIKFESGRKVYLILCFLTAINYKKISARWQTAGNAGTVNLTVSHMWISLPKE